MELYLLIITIFLLAVALLAKVLPETMKIKASTFFRLLVVAFVLCSLFPFFITSLGAVMTFSLYTCLLLIAGFALAYLEEPASLLKASQSMNSEDSEEAFLEESWENEKATASQSGEALDEICCLEPEEELLQRSVFKAEQEQRDPLVIEAENKDEFFHEAEVEAEAEEEPLAEQLPKEFLSDEEIMPDEAESEDENEFSDEAKVEEEPIKEQPADKPLLEEFVTEGDMPEPVLEKIVTESEEEQELLIKEILLGRTELVPEVEAEEATLQKVEYLEEEAVFESEIKEEEAQEPAVLEKAEEETVLPEFEEELCRETFLPNFEPDEELAAVSQEEIRAEEALVEVQEINISEEGGHRESVMEEQHKESIEELVAKGFAARRAGNNRDAVEYFFAALDCDPNEELKVLLTLEAAAVYQELGHYSQAVMLLASALSGGGLRDKALKEELRAQMYTLESVSRMLGLAKTPDLPFSQVPRVIRLKAGVEAAERLKKTKEEE